MIVRRMDFIMQQRMFAKKSSNIDIVQDPAQQEYVNKLASDPKKVAEHQAKLTELRGGAVPTELSPMQKRQVEKMSGKGYTHKYENGNLTFFDKAGKEAQYHEVFKSSKAIAPVPKKPKPEATTSAPVEPKPEVVKSAPTEVTPQQPSSQPNQQKPKGKKKNNKQGSGGKPSTPQQPVNPQPQGGTWTSSTTTSTTPSPQPSTTNTVTNNLQKNKGFFGKMTKNQKIMGGLALGAAAGAGLYAYQKHKDKKV